MVREDKAARKAPVRRGRSEGPGESRDAAGAADERFAEGRPSAEGGSTPPEHKNGKGAPVRRGRVGKRRNRLTTDAVREVKSTFSRFLSILVLAALAVAFVISFSISYYALGRYRKWLAEQEAEDQEKQA